MYKKVNGVYLKTDEKTDEFQPFSSEQTSFKHTQGYYVANLPSFNVLNCDGEYCQIVKNLLGVYYPTGYYYKKAEMHYRVYEVSPPLGYEITPPGSKIDPSRIYADYTPQINYYSMAPNNKYAVFNSSEVEQITINPELINDSILQIGTISSTGTLKGGKVIIWKNYPVNGFYIKTVEYGGNQDTLFGFKYSVLNKVGGKLKECVKITETERAEKKACSS